jgi:hypothetical protein
MEDPDMVKIMPNEDYQKRRDREVWSYPFKIDEVDDF